MKPNIFLPDLQKIYSDSLGDYLKQIAQVFIIFSFALLPIFFIPNVYTFLGYTKIYLVVLFLLLAIVASSFSVLRSGVVRLFVPLSLGFFWLFALLSIVSGFLTSDRSDALFGGVMDSGSASFMVLMAVVMTVALIFKGATPAIGRILFGLGASSVLLQLYHLLRVIFGPDFLSFKLFNSQTTSLIGSFNDLAIFSGLIIITCLIMVQGVKNSLFHRIVLAFLIVSSLFSLSLVNFGTVWLIVGFFSFVILLYLIARDTWLKREGSGGEKVSRFALLMVGITCLTSGLFVVGGDFFSTTISRATGITYLEVRPSFNATVDIIDSVWSQNILLGVGTNRFIDAWRQYKDPAINGTLLWATDFNSGSGLVPTFFATTGLAGGVALLAFLLSFLYLGYKLFYQIKIEDPLTYRLAAITFSASVYLWFMSLVYVPGVTLLLMAALTTGLTFAIYSGTIPSRGLLLNVSEKKQYGLLLIIFVMIVITASIMSFIKVSKNYYANVIYNKALVSYVENKDIASLDIALNQVALLNPLDTYYAERARLRLIEIGRINSLAEPTPADEQKFTVAMNEGVELASQAVSLDPTDPSNYLLLANFLAVYDPAANKAVKERTESILKQAQILDPKNPSYLSGLAQYAMRSGDNSSARNYLNEAIKLKPNYTNALLQLSQIDIVEGNATSAIATTRSIIAIEPQNPARYLQLGLLFAASLDIPNAILAYKSALTLDPNYANARYFLALAYDATGKRDQALAELNQVLTTNQENEVVKKMIERLEAGLPAVPVANIEGSVDPVTEGQAQKDGEVVTTPKDPNSDLLTPINTVPKETESVESNTPSTATSS